MMVINQTKLKLLEKHTVNFSVAIVKTSVKYSGDAALKPIIDQLVQSATSIGAYYAEANNAVSKADFTNMIILANKEAGKTRYWLKVLSELLPKENLSRLSQEALKLALVFQKIVTTMEDSSQ